MAPTGGSVLAPSPVTLTSTLPAGPYPQLTPTVTGSPCPAWEEDDGGSGSLRTSISRSTVALLPRVRTAFRRLKTRPMGLVLWGPIS